MKRFVGIAFFCFATACQKEEEPGIIPVDSVIQVEVKEATIENSKRIILSTKTEAEYTCSNYSLLTDKEVRKEGFTITFSGMSTPNNVCATAMGPARKDVDLGTLQNGTFELELNGNPFSNQGTLEVTDQKLILDFPQQNGIEIISPRVQR